MKASFFVIITLFVALACNSKQDQPPQDAETTSDVGSEIAENGLSLDSAHYYIRIYNQKMFSVTRNVNPFRAFRIPAADLLESIGAPKGVKPPTFPYARLYVGMDTLGRLRAFLTPVVHSEKNKAGRDSVLYGKYREGWGPNGEVKEGFYVLDFTMPCPNSCDAASKVLEDTF